MRYTYTLYRGYRTKPLTSGKSTRIHICTRFEEILKELHDSLLADKDSPWFIEVYDNLKNVWDCDLVNQDDIDGWETARDRDIWLDKKHAVAPSKPDWKPFDEEESGIHVKQEGSHELPLDLTEFIQEVPKPTLDRNVKTAAAIGKPKLSDVPTVAFFAIGAAMSDGASKYGRFNWRSTEVTASVFYDAMMRHLTAWYAGEDHASDSKIHHLAHLMAGAAIVLDAECHKVFTDDRDVNRLVVPREGDWTKE